jgi:hypothetical protein
VREKRLPIQRPRLVDLDFYTLPILYDALDNIFFAIFNRFCITDSVLSDENGADDKEKYRAGDVACADHSTWNVVTAH